MRMSGARFAAASIPAKATVAITGGFDTTDDVLGFISGGGFSGTYDSGTGILTITGNKSLADYQAALRSVTYENTSSTPPQVPREISFTITDQHGTDSNTDTRDINITQVNDPPVNALPAAGALNLDEDDDVTVNNAFRPAGPLSLP